MTGAFSSILEYPLVSRVRRNHGLEHATINVLTAGKFASSSLAGHSDARGFWLLGEVSTEHVKAATAQALARLRAGEHSLAIHPNCGTNFVVTGSIAGLMGAFAMLGVRSRKQALLERLPLAAGLATLALILAQPLGFRAQEHITVSGNPDKLEIVEIIRTTRAGMTAHRVVTEG